MIPPLVLWLRLLLFCFSHNPFIFLLSFYSFWRLFFPLVMGTSLAGDVLTTDSGSGIHSKGKRSQGHFRQGYLYYREWRKLNKKGIDAKQPFKRVFFTSWLFVCGIFPAHSLLLWRRALIDNKEERGRERERRGRESEVFTTEFLNP